MLVFTRVGNMASGNVLGEAFGYGGAGAAVGTHENRYVPSRSAEYLGDTPNFLFPADDRVEPAHAGFPGEIPAERPEPHGRGLGPRASRRGELPIRVVTQVAHHLPAYCDRVGAQF